MGDHWIVGRIRIFRDVEILLDDPPRVRKEGPMSADTGAIFVRLDDVVGADCDKAAIANLHLTVEFKKPFGLSAVLGAITTATEDENHRILFLEFGEPPVCRGMVGKLVVGEDSPRDHVVSHRNTSSAFRESSHRFQDVTIWRSPSVVPVPSSRSLQDRDPPREAGSVSEAPWPAQEAPNDKIARSTGASCATNRANEAPSASTFVSYCAPMNATAIRTHIPKVVGTSPVHAVNAAKHT